MDPANVLLETMRTYAEHSHREVHRVHRNLTGLSDDDQASLTWKAEDQLQKMKEAVSANLEFLGNIGNLIREVQASGSLPGLDGQPSCVPQGSKATQNLLQMFVREWSSEGLEERQECFDKLLGSLDSHLRPQLDQAKVSGASATKVLCPGVQLGRLFFEVLARGYAAEACESRPLFFFGGEFLRKHCTQREVHRIQPFVLQTCNRFRTEDHIRVAAIPDVDIAEGALPPVRFGDFVRLYDTANARGSFDAMLTAFALDTSSNIFRYVRTAAHVIRPGGLWANFGPLAYDAEHDEAHGNGVELSWEELSYAVSHFFDIQEQAFVSAFHASNLKSMMQIQYSCVFFKAVRNDRPSPGIGGT